MSVSAATSRLSFVFSSISERWSNRLEAARNRYKEILALEHKRLKDLEAHAQQAKSKSLAERSPEGFLSDEAQGVAYPLYSGSNLFEGLEIKLKGSSVYCGAQVYASNDRLEAGGRKFLIKLLPPVYRSEGARS